MECLAPHGSAEGPGGTDDGKIDRADLGFGRKCRFRRVWPVPADELTGDDGGDRDACHLSQPHQPVCPLLRVLCARCYSLTFVRVESLHVQEQSKVNATRSNDGILAVLTRTLPTASQMASASVAS